MPDERAQTANASPPRVRVPRDSIAFLRIAFAEKIAAKVRAAAQDTAADRWRFVEGFGGLASGGEPDERAIFDAFESMARRAVPGGRPDAEPGYVLRWICEKFLSVETPIRAEDIYKVGEDINLLIRYKALLRRDGGATDLRHYSNLDALERAMAPYRELAARKAEGDDVARQARAESTILYHGPEGMIVVPHSTTASRFWGLGTKWCVSAAHSQNMFQRYNAKGPMLMFLLPGGADSKYALHYAERQVRDSKDKELARAPAALHHLLAAAPEGVRAYVNAQVAPGSGAERAFAAPSFGDLPDIGRTLELCKLAVRQDGCALRHVPDDMLTPELCELAVRQNPLALQHVPEDMRTLGLCMLALRRDGWTLAYVPIDMRTRELCELAVSKEAVALQHVPDEMRTLELCELAVRQNGSALWCVPEHMRTAELCALAVQGVGLALEYVPQNIRTPELCELAVRQDGLALGCVPEKLRTLQLCELAVRENGLALGSVPVRKRTPEICESAVQQHGSALTYVPLRMRSLELSELAVRRSGKALKYVPDMYHEPTLYELALEGLRHHERHEQRYAHARTILSCARKYKLKPHRLLADLLARHQELRPFFAHLVPANQGNAEKLLAAAVIDDTARQPTRPTPMAARRPSPLSPRGPS